MTASPHDLETRAAERRVQFRRFMRRASCCKTESKVGKMEVEPEGGVGSPRQAKILRRISGGTLGEDEG